MARKLSKKNTKVQKVIKKVKPVTAGHGSSAMQAVNLPKGEYTEAVGRRKVATARVRLYHQAGDFIVNGKAIGQYFNTIVHAPGKYQIPFELTGTKNTFAVSAKVSGSGSSAQLEAVIHGIARALIEYKPEFRGVLKAAGLLTRDDRMKETRKIGMGGKARRSRQSPKR